MDCRLSGVLQGAKCTGNENKNGQVRLHQWNEKTCSIFLLDNVLISIIYKELKPFQSIIIMIIIITNNIYKSNNNGNTIRL